MKEALVGLALAIGGLVLLIGFIGGLFALSSLILMWLWNWIAFGVFGLPELTFWTAMGLNLLLEIIGSFFKSNK